jgi:predicted NBD/HSP70 family sugar kinase
MRVRDPKGIIEFGGGISQGHLSKAGRRSVDEVRARPLPDSILHLIWREHQISRAEIARRFKLSRSTVTEIIKELLQSGFVAEVGIGQSSGGRRPIVLEFQNEARCILGIDIGATHVSVVLTDLHGQILVWKEKEHPVRSDPDGTRTLVIELCGECLATWAGGSERLFSIGVAVPSPVDPIHPEWLSEVVVPAWRGRSELERLNQHYKVPVYVDNDANLGALAEHLWGAGRGIDDLIYIKIAHGIGAGYILNGKIYRGAWGIAGEMSHMPIDPGGKQCVCGLNGCLATFFSAPALAERAGELLPDNPESILTTEKLTITDIEEAALASDKVALRLVREAAEYLSIAVAGWINMMNPKMVILGGSMARLGNLLLEPIRKKVESCTLVSSPDTVSIEPGELGSQAVAIGAATLAVQRAFDQHHFYRREPQTLII